MTQVRSEYMLRLSGPRGASGAIFCGASLPIERWSPMGGIAMVTCQVTVTAPTTVAHPGAASSVVYTDTAEKPPAGGAWSAAPRGRAIRELDRVSVYPAPMAITRTLVAAAVAVGAASLPAAAAPAFRGGVSPLPAVVKQRMTPSVWRPGCPVPLNRLRRVVVTHHDFRGRTRRGIVVVNVDVAARVLRAFRLMYEAGVPIRRMRPIEAYGGDDFRSIEADNTSAFNCRAATGSSRWSQHAYGRAIDVNPIENPYVSGGSTSHRASVPFLDRTRVRPGMAVEGGPMVAAFDAVGLQWGGRWSGTKDYQHFSVGG